MAKQQTVSKADLVNSLTSETRFQKKEARNVIDLALEHIVNSLAKGDKVQLTGFGTFEVRQRQARTGVRPGTTERIQIPASKYPAFRAGKTLKDSIGR